MKHASLFLVHLTETYLRWAYYSPHMGHRPLLALSDLNRKEKKKNLQSTSIVIIMVPVDLRNCVHVGATSQFSPHLIFATTVEIAKIGDRLIILVE